MPPRKNGVLKDFFSVIYKSNDINYVKSAEVIMIKQLAPSNDKFNATDNFLKLF